MTQHFMDASSIKKEVGDGVFYAKQPKLEHAGGDQTRVQVDSKEDLAKLTKREKQRIRAAIANGQSGPKQKRAQPAETKATKKAMKKAEKKAKKKSEKKARRRARRKAEAKVVTASTKCCSQIKLAFIATNRSPPLSAEHMARLQQVILELTVSHTAPNVFPQFEDCAPQSEWLLLVCANRMTADWVRHNFAYMRNKSGLSIELLEDKQIPRNLIDGYFPNSAQLPDDKVLALISAQNPIKTRQWRIIRRAVDGHILRLTMAIDDDSMRKLGACGGYISYCFGSICLNLNYDRSPRDQACGSAWHQFNADNSTDQMPGNDWNSILTQLDSVLDGVEDLHIPVGDNSTWNNPFNQAHNARQ